jgi:hypothetical protein
LAYPVNVRSIVRSLALVFVLALTAAACTQNTAISPTPAPLNVTGTWSGNLALSSTTAKMTWTLTQTNNAVSGPVLVTQPSGVVLLNGTLGGTLSGTTLPYTITIGPSGIPSDPTCTGQLSGMVIGVVSTTSTLTGSYEVASSTCNTGFSSGNFTLTKQ